ncbi:PREDICTED: protein unc-45 homolog A-like [Camelina sativa]|uniref:Protein unc-45 homolog A-like n=1 Tax=Camelina sativa TaxID=90675 RepID=A0ABM0YI74_CAMSA|nr:PREDICTED: protein unc-45 homolog A-like [Camelina sativa]
MASVVTATATGKVEKGHQLYREGKYREALLFYTEALTAAKPKPQKIALHSNRAACYLKLHDFNKAAEECSWVLELDQKHSGALMLRAQTLVTLKEYQSALFDVTRLLELNPDSEVYLNLESRLRTQLPLAPIPESEEEFEQDEEQESDDVEQDTAEKKYRQVERALHERRDKRFDSVVAIRKDLETTLNKVEVVAPKTPEVRDQNCKEVPLSGKQQSNAWQAIPKPKGHSTLDYARWDSVEDGSSEEDDDDDSDDSDESPPQYRFRVKTVGVRPVK